MRFTVDGSEALEDRISQHMAQIRSAIERGELDQFADDFYARQARGL